MFNMHFNSEDLRFNAPAKGQDCRIAKGGFASVTIFDNPHDKDKVVVGAYAVHGSANVFLTPSEARRMAKALLEAAEMQEETKG